MARATYAAYNGGPKHLTRYRNTKTAGPLREIDRAFWQKFQATKSGDVLAVARCYGDPRLSDDTSKKAQIKPNAEIESDKKSSEKIGGRVNAAGSHRSNTRNQQPWLLRKDPRHFTLQLAASRDQNAISSYIESNQMGKQAAVYRYRRDGNTWFGVIYGSYPTRRQAETAAADLKQTRGLSNPWIRQFAGIQKLISE